MLKYRIAYILTLTAAVLFYVFYTQYLSFFVLAAVIAMPVLSWIITLIAVSKTNIRIEPKTPYANKEDEILLRVILKNNSIFPIAQAWLKLSFENALSGENRYESLFLPVSSGPEQAAEYRIKSHHCGKITVRLTRVKYYDYLGIFAIKRSSKPASDLFVAPKAHFIDSKIDTAAEPGTESNVFSKYKPGDDPSEIFDIRPFRSGDRLRSVHWKLSSKLDELMVKEFSLPTDSSVLLLTELTAFSMDALDTVVETLASLSRFLLENEIWHNVEWYDAEHSIFQEARIESDEDLALLINAVLSARQYSEEPYALAFRNRLGDAARNYPHAIYLTGRLTGELTTFCSNRVNGEKTTVLFCGEIESGQNELAEILRSLHTQVLSIPSGKIQESLSGLTI